MEVLFIKLTVLGAVSSSHSSLIHLTRFVSRPHVVLMEIYEEVKTSSHLLHAALSLMHLKLIYKEGKYERTNCLHFYRPFHYSTNKVVSKAAVCVGERWSLIQIRFQTSEFFKS